MKRPLTVVLLAFAVSFAALAAAGPGVAGTPCWKTLVNDWYDGRIDSVYPVSCYREALANLPEDVAQYSSLEDDINRALAAAIAGGGGLPPADSTGSNTFHGGPKSERGAGSSASAGRDEGEGPVGQVISSFGGGSADSVPVPLIVLGSLAIVLLALGAAGFIARRLQMRKVTDRPSTRT